MQKTAKKTTPKKRKAPKKKVGRKLFDGKDVKWVVAKLEQAAALDATVEEMCFYADISHDSYYRYIKKNIKFRNRIQGLRTKPVLLARQTVIKGIGDNFGNAMTYLERKRKGEFSSKIELQHDVDLKHTHNIDPKAKKSIDNIFALFEKKARETEPSVIVKDDDE